MLTTTTCFHAPYYESIILKNHRLYSTIKMYSLYNVVSIVTEMDTTLIQKWCLSCILLVKQSALNPYGSWKPTVATKNKTEYIISASRFNKIKLILKSPLIPNHPSMTPNAPNTKGKNRLMSITLSLQNKEVINKKKTRDNNEKHFSIAFDFLFNTK